MKSFTNLSKMTVVSVFLVGCATGPAPGPALQPDPATALAALMVGTYQPQTANAATTDTVRETRTKIEPLGPGQWIYQQVNDAPGLKPALGKITQQRILSLRTKADGRVIQTRYALITPTAYQAMGDSLSDLTRAQLRPQWGDGCEMIWIEMPNGWAGQIDPSRCVIVSPTQKGALRMGGRADIIGNRLRHAETGYDLDGNRLWGAEDGEWAVLYRTP